MFCCFDGTDFQRPLFFHYGRACPLRFTLDSINGKKIEVQYFAFAKVLTKIRLKFLNPELTKMRGNKLSHTQLVGV